MAAAGLAVSPPTAADAKAYLTGSFVFGSQTASQMAGLAIGIERYRLGDDHVSRYPALMRAITPLDVSRVAREHLTPDALSEVVVGPAAAAAAAASAATATATDAATRPVPRDVHR